MSAADETSAKPAPRKKLGRGLGALMGETRREEPLIRAPQRGEDAASRQTTANRDDSPASSGGSGNILKNIDISAIKPLPNQPRSHFDEEALAELAASIEARGVIQPVIVRPAGDGAYQLVAGERRWRAAQKARLHQIPAIVRDLDDREVTALALIENLQREDLSPVEEARAYRRLAEEDGMSQAEIARMVDKSRSHVANFQRLLALPEEVLALLAGGDLSMGHARALIGHSYATGLARRAVADSLSVREVEKLARSDEPVRKRGESRSGSGSGAKDADIAAVQAHLEEFLGLNVRIKTGTSPSKGAVTIHYRTLDQLDLICQRLTGGEI